MSTVRKVWWKDPKQWRKGQIGIAAAIAVLASQGLLEGEVEAWVTGISSAIGAFLTVVVPNDRPIVTEEADERLVELDPPGSSRL